MHLTDINNMDGAGHRPPLHNSVLQFGSSPPQSWLQSPPTQMPWGTSQPTLVRFTADSSTGVNGCRFFPNGSIPSQTPSSYTQTVSTFTQSQSFMPTAFPSPTSSVFSSAQQNPISPPSGGLKRKLDAADDAEMLCAVNKLHISERKLVSHHEGVHIHDNVASTSASNGILSVNDIGEGQRIILSEEVQQFSSPKSILPQPLLDRINCSTRPSMALVLWQPPNPRLMPAPVDQNLSAEEEENNPEPRVDVDNNNSSTVDLNHLPSFGDMMAPAQPTLNVNLNDDDIDMEQL